MPAERSGVKISRCTMGVLKNFLLMCSVLQAGAQAQCISKDFGRGGTACVCDANHCDSLGKIPSVEPGKALLYESNKDGARFVPTVLEFNKIASAPGPSPGSSQNWWSSITSSLADGISNRANPAQIIIDRTKQHQEIFGFGGSFTDAAGINFLNLDESLRKKLLESYFTEEGLNYTFARVPIGSCDFSTHPYSYCDAPGDLNLSHFNLAMEDLKYKIPFIKEAQEMSSHKLLLIASPWSAPAWMKTNNNMKGRGTLKGSPGGEYYKSWANYFVKFLENYESEGIQFWGLTAQNEPTAGHIPFYPFQCMGFTANSQRDFIKMDLGPTLEKAGYGRDKLNLIILDDNRSNLPRWADVVLKDPEAAKYVSGIGFHWYWNHITGPSVLDQTHERHPNMFLLATEACEGSASLSSNRVIMGSWKRAESYAADIIEDLQHWTSGWIDWNLALDMEGGPNWVKNYVDAPIIVDRDAQKFYKQPMYYALAHFSKFIIPGSRRIGAKNTRNNLEVAAFQRPDGAVTLVIVNKSSNSQNLNINYPESGFLHTKIPAHAIQSYIWWPEVEE